MKIRVTTDIELDERTAVQTVEAVRIRGDEEVIITDNGGPGTLGGAGEGERDNLYVKIKQAKLPGLAGNARAQIILKRDIPLRKVKIAGVTQAKRGALLREFEVQAGSEWISGAYQNSPDGVFVLRASKELTPWSSIGADEHGYVMSGVGPITHVRVVTEEETIELDDPPNHVGTSIEFTV
jgi:hypothetical protein